MLVTGCWVLHLPRRQQPEGRLPARSARARGCAHQVPGDGARHAAYVLRLVGHRASYQLHGRSPHGARLVRARLCTHTCCCSSCRSSRRLLSCSACAGACHAALHRRCPTFISFTSQCCSSTARAATRRPAASNTARTGIATVHSCPTASSQASTRGRRLRHSAARATPLWVRLA